MAEVLKMMGFNRRGSETMPQADEADESGGWGSAAVGVALQPTSQDDSPIAPEAAGFPRDLNKPHYVESGAMSEVSISTTQEQSASDSRAPEMSKPHSEHGPLGQAVPVAIPASTLVPTGEKGLPAVQAAPAGEKTVIGRSMVMECGTVKTPDQEVSVFGALSGKVECRSFILEKGGCFEGHIIATELVEINGNVKNSRITAPAIRILGCSNIGYDTVIVGETIGQQIGARVDARVISDPTLQADDRILIVADPQLYATLPPRLVGRTA
jgi:hypothetical protein